MPIIKKMKINRSLFTVLASFFRTYFSRQTTWYYLGLIIILLVGCYLLVSCIGFWWVVAIVLGLCFFITLTFTYRYVYYGFSPTLNDIQPQILYQKLKQYIIGWIQFTTQRWYWAKAKEISAPGFLLLGTSLSHKDDIVKCAGLHFSLMPENILNTKDVRCWFSNEAVLFNPTLCLDAPCEDTQWLGILQQIKKLHRKVSLQGIFVVISSSELILFSSEKNNHLEQVKQRLDIIYTQLGQRLPVHFLLNIGNDMPGFVPFFRHLDDRSRKKPFGMLLDEPVVQSLSTAWQTLQQRLAYRALQQLSAEADVAAKLASLSFLEQFNKLGEQAKAIIGYLSRASIYQETLCLKSFHVINTRSATHFFFVEDTLKEQLFTLAYSREWTKKKLWQQRWKERLQVVGMVLVGVSGVIFATKAYIVNAAYVKQGHILAERGLNELHHTHRASLSPMLLEDIAKHIQALHHFAVKQRWYQCLGGNISKTQQAFEQILEHQLTHTMYLPIRRYLGQQLTHFHQQWLVANQQKKEQLRGNYYSLLKLYLMLYFPKQLDRDFASFYLAQQWYSFTHHQSVPTFSQVEALYPIVHSYLDYLTRLDEKNIRRFGPYNSLIIAHARADLGTASGVSNIYAFLKTVFRHKLGFIHYETFFNDTVADLWRSEYQLSALYTPRAYERYLKAAFLKQSQLDARHDWVIHAELTQLASQIAKDVQVQQSNSQQSHQLLNELHTLYAQNYWREWLAFTSSLRMVDFATYDDMVQQLSESYTAEGALQQLFNVLHSQMNLKTVLSTNDYEALPKPVRHAYETILMTTETMKGNTAFLARYFQQLALLQQDMERLAIGEHVAENARHYIALLLQGKGQDTELYKTSLLAEQLATTLESPIARQAIKHVLLSPVSATYKALLTETLKNLQREWQQVVLAPFQQHLASYFPFDKHGADADIAQFNAFFRPKHGVWAQYLHLLRPFIQQEGERYTVKQWLGIGLPLSVDVLKRMYQLEQISHSLFVHGGSDLSLHYSIYPIPTPGIKEILFASNGQVYPYRNGPQEWVAFSWPSQDPMENESFIRITKTTADLQSAKEFSGTWGLFHLFYAASQVKKTEKGYHLVWFFKQGGLSKPVQLLVTAKAPMDVLGLLLFNPIQLPEALDDTFTMI